MNQKIQSILQQQVPEKNVLVRIGSHEYGGVWHWEGEKHRRIFLDELKAWAANSGQNWLTYVKTLPLAKIEK
jgi:hypothetical protein